MSARARAERAMPGVALEALGRGLDNTAFAAGDLVVRVAETDSVPREAALLAVLRDRLSLPVPRVHLADAANGVLAYRRLPGRSLLDRAAPPGLAAPLGRFLRELHAVDPADAPVPVEDAHPAEWLQDLEGPPELLRLLRDTVPQPAARRVLCHADLGAEHILEDGGAITGVIDWTDAAVTDPALDFARLLRDFGPGFLDGVIDAYGPAPDRARITYFARCAALEDLAYGEPAYVRAARRSFEWLLPGGAGGAL